MKSLCIKTNNSNVTDYLLNELENLNIDNVYFVCKPFKSYRNIIIHYKGENEELFYTEISTCLSYLIIDEFEEELLKSLIEKEYFYFNTNEINKVLNNCMELICSNGFSFEDRYLVLFNKFYKYISLNKALYLQGFINFKLKEYKNILENIVTTSVNNYIIEREYLEFISLLKIYVKSNCSNANIIHLIYSDSCISLLDENLSNINIKDFELNTKYLSDISFSSNDYILNALLNILPKQIIIHTSIDNSDEFINTLKLIFENRIKMEVI